MILVAGGTGFVGSAIVRELCGRGEQVAVLTRSTAGAMDRFPGFDVTFKQGDVTEPASLEGSMTGIDVVVGCQQFSNSPIENPGKGQTFERVDAMGTENLVKEAVRAGVKQYVYLSGAGASPEGRHWFRAKWRAEQAVINSGIPYTIFRPSWVYGPEDNSLNRFVRMAKFAPLVPQIGDIGKQRMQPVFVEDVARAVAAAIGNEAAHGKVFEIGGLEVLSMKEVVAAALEAAGRKRPILAAPAGLMKAAASVLQFAPGRPLSPDAVDFITADALGDSTEVRTVLGVEPTPLSEGLASYLGKP